MTIVLMMGIADASLAFHNGRTGLESPMRLFAALPVPDVIAQRLGGIQNGVAGARWRPRENLHITLCFYGEVADPHSIEALDDALSCIRAPVLRLSLGEAGAFGDKEPRALWMGITPNAALKQLAGDCTAAAQRLGLKKNRQHYIPHITLAYCRGVTDGDAARYLQRLSSFNAPEFEVDQFSLYRSYLGTDPARYVFQAEYPLGSKG